MQIDRNSLRLSGRHSHVFDTVFQRPAASCICRYGIISPPLTSCDAARNVLPSGQSTQPFSSKTARPAGAA